MTVEWPDTEGAVRDYLRGHTDVTAQVGTRVFFSIPDQPTWPLVVVRRVAGGDDTSEAPLDQAVIQIDCWAAGRNKQQATDVVNAVRQALYELRGATALNDDVVGYGARIDSIVFLPDPADDRPRYALTAQITTRAAA